MNELEAIKKLEDLEAWVKSRPALTQEDFRAIAETVNQKPEFVQLHKEIAELEAIRAALGGGKNED